MISYEYELEKQPTKSCNICHNFYDEAVSCREVFSQKIYNNCTKYLHSAIIGSTLEKDKEPAGSIEMETTVICPDCFASAVQLTKLSDQLELLQKSVNDFLLTFSLTVLHRRSKVKSDRKEQVNVEIDISKFPDVINVALRDEGQEPFFDQRVKTEIEEIDESDEDYQDYVLTDKEEENVKLAENTNASWRKRILSTEVTEENFPLKRLFVRSQSVPSTQAKQDAKAATLSEDSTNSRARNILTKFSGSGRKRDPIWKHYIYSCKTTKDGYRAKALCIYCKASISAEAKRLRSHYEKCSRDKYDAGQESTHATNPIHADPIQADPITVKDLKSVTTSNDAQSLSSPQPKEVVRSIMFAEDTISNARESLIKHNGRKLDPIWNHYIYNSKGTSEGCRARALCVYCNKRISAEAKRLRTHYEKCSRRKEGETQNPKVPVNVTDQSTGELPDNITIIKTC